MDEVRFVLGSSFCIIKRILLIFIFVICGGCGDVSKDRGNDDLVTFSQPNFRIDELYKLMIEKKIIPCKMAFQRNSIIERSNWLFVKKV